MTGGDIMERTFHGKTRAEMNVVLNYMCLLKDQLNIPPEDSENFDVAIQCVTVITNRMADNKMIEWD